MEENNQREEWFSNQCSAGTDYCLLNSLSFCYIFTPLTPFIRKVLKLALCQKYSKLSLQLQEPIQKKETLNTLDFKQKQKADQYNPILFCIWGNLLGKVSGRPVQGLPKGCV